MDTAIIEFTTLVLFVGCFWHAARYESRAFAQQWFIAGYLFAIIRETVVLVVLQTYGYAPSITRLGVVPVIICLLYPSVFYLAYFIARRFTFAQGALASAGLVFLIVASIALPIETTAARAQWWAYASPARVIFGGMPLTAPLVWGGGAAIFYAVFARIRTSLLPERGKLYALITLAPVMAAAHLLWMFLIGGL